jgi:hypothetical protein
MRTLIPICLGLATLAVGIALTAPVALQSAAGFRMLLAALP